jgi:hypothetical protein
MASLKLIPANESRSQGPWSADDYDVMLLDTGERVGRIYGRLAVGARGLEWFWTLGFPFTLNARQPFYGVADSKDEAKSAFAERWRAIPSASPSTAHPDS